MNVSFAFRHLSEESMRLPLEERLVELASGFDRYFVDLQTVHWTVTEAAGGFEVGSELHARSGVYRATSISSDAWVAANQTFEKLVKQRRRVKKQRLGGRRGDLARSQSATVGAPDLPDSTEVES